MNWTTRLAGEADAAGVERVLISAYPALDAPGEDAGRVAAALAAIRAAPIHLLVSGRYFVAEAAGEAIGCGGWSPTPPPGVAARVGTGHLRHFATRADWTGRGVATSLFAACLAQSRAEGMTRLDVVSTLGAERFYRRLGFEALGPIVAPIAGLSLPAVYLTRRLGG
jgi:predicted N-acetyltransferase YhbS